MPQVRFVFVGAARLGSCEGEIVVEGAEFETRRGCREGDSRGVGRECGMLDLTFK